MCMKFTDSGMSESASLIMAPVMAPDVGRRGLFAARDDIGCMGRAR
jgi:hypothetical protein